MNARPMLDGPLKDAPRLVEVVAGVEHELDPQSVLAPLLDLVEVAPVGVGWVVGFFVGPVAHCTKARTGEEKAGQDGSMPVGGDACQEAVLGW